MGRRDVTVPGITTAVAETDPAQDAETGAIIVSDAHIKTVEREAGAGVHEGGHTETKKPGGPGVQVASGDEARIAGSKARDADGMRALEMTEKSHGDTETESQRKATDRFRNLRSFANVVYVMLRTFRAWLS